MSINRREFLAFAAALGASRAMAAIRPDPSPATGSGDYRALVCIFLQGGNDAANLLLATDTASWDRYQSARRVDPSPIALAAPGEPSMPGALGTIGAGALGGVLPIQPRTAQPWPAGTPGSGLRTFALHPLMTNLQAMFQQGTAALVANLGPLVLPVTRTQYLDGSIPLPRSLFSHNDQTSVWQTGGAEGTSVGWGGLLGDLLAQLNTHAAFTAITLTGNAPLLAGRTVRAYQVSREGAVAIQGLTAPSLFGNASGPALLRAILTQAGSASPFELGYASVASRSIENEALLNSALSATTAVPDPPGYLDPWSGATKTNPLALSLQAVARMIAAAPGLGLRRQVFFVGHGPFDFHQSANQGHPAMLAGLDAALSYFQGLLGNLGGKDLRTNVTTFSMSEFGRCLVSNGSGTDHGWGGHHLVVGGAVKGGDIHGVYPTVGVDQGTWINPDALPMTGAWIPTTSVDQYAAPLAAWMGASPAQLAAIFPNLANFPAGPVQYL